MPTTNNISELSKQYGYSSSNASKTELDKNAFLSLLITQMQYQDPLNPVEDKEFLAQMAQFTALEQMQNMNVTLKEQHANSLVGKYVVAENYDDTTRQTEIIEGRVEGMVNKNSEMYLIIGDKEVLASKVKQVYEDYTELQQMSAIQEAINISQNIGLIGKTVQGFEIDSTTGKPTNFVEGKVDYVKFDNGNAILVVGGKEIYASQIASVSDNSLITGSTIKVPVTDADGVESLVDKTISDIVVRNDKYYVETSDGERYKIENFGALYNGFAKIGTTVTSSDAEYVIDGVSLRDGSLYLTSGSTELLLTSYL